MQIAVPQRFPALERRLQVIPKARLDEPRERAKLQSEIAIHSRMRHENVARFLTSWDDPSNVYLLMELCPGRTLEDVVNSKGSLSEAEAAHFMDQILEALDYIHSSRCDPRRIRRPAGANRDSARGAAEAALRCAC